MKLVIPNVKQPDDFSCGAAAIEMLLRYHEASVPKDLRKLCCPHDGLQPDAIKAILQRTWGHHTSARMTTGILRGYLRDGKPVICPVYLEGWVSSHWVVVSGFTNRLIWYSCPLEGSQSMPIEKWESAWRDEAVDSSWQHWGITSWPL